MPAFFRLRALRLHAAWGAVGLLSGLNFLLFIYLGLRRDQEKAAQGVRWLRVILLVLLGHVAGYALYCLLMYVPWLAAKS